ncbi:MAG: VOC family protein [Candidatus Dormibacteraeota bacterium]|nr:VOC family protein [Candidatus Dormibacteraeota bacterium]
MSVKRLDHVGVVVADLPGAQRFLSEVLGLQLDREVDASAIGRRGVFYKCGDVEIELIQELDPAARDRVLEGAQAKIDHLALTVDSLAETMASLEAKGVSFGRGPVEIGGRQNAWTEQRTSGGVTYQLVQKP